MGISHAQQSYLSSCDVFQRIVPAYGSENDQLNPWVAATQTGYQETWNNKLQANATLEQSLNFITKGLKFIGRYGFDTNNYQWINRKKFPEMWRAEQKSCF